MVRHELELLIRDPRFWTSAYWITRPDEDEEDDAAVNAVRFQVTHNHSLELSFDAGYERFSLMLCTGDQEMQVAWDDRAHWHPHLLRWRELDALCAAITARDPALVHAGVPLLLLARFAPITDDDDARLALTLIDEARQRLGAFRSQRERTELFDKLDARGAGFRWQRESKGWVVVQAEDDRPRSKALYSLRTSDSAEFPFTAFEAMLAAIPPSTRSAAAVAVPVPIVHLSLDMTHSSACPAHAAQYAAQFVDAALRDRDVGAAEVNGSAYEIDGTAISSMIAIRIRDDEAQARAKIAALLDQCGVLAATRCSTGDLVPAPPPARYVQLCDLEIEHSAIDGRTYTHCIRQRFGDEHRELIESVLARYGFSDEHEVGLRTCALPDGAVIEAAFPGLATGKGSHGSLWLSALTEASIEVVDALMGEGGLVCVAPLIAPSETHLSYLQTPWPAVHVANDAVELAALLRPE